MRDLHAARSPNSPTWPGSAARCRAPHRWRARARGLGADPGRDRLRCFEQPGDVATPRVGPKPRQPTPVDSPSAVEPLTSPTRSPDQWTPLRRERLSGPPNARISRPAAAARILAFALAAVVALIVGVGIGLGWSGCCQPADTDRHRPGAARRRSPSPGPAPPARPPWSATRPVSEILVVRVSTPRPVPGIRTVWMMDPTAKRMQTVGQLTGTEGRFESARRPTSSQVPGRRRLRGAAGRRGSRRTPASPSCAAP